VLQSLIDLFHRIYDVQAIVTFGGLLGLVLVIFAETGLLVGFFLPGDSLLVTAGIFCSSANPTGRPLLNIVWVIGAVSVAAIAGDTVGYWIGAKSGPHLFTREDSLLFKKRYLRQTQEFYDRHGGKTIIMARFIPIVRTFAPVVAGAAKMSYRRFLSYNVFGGIFWVVSMTVLGYGLASVYPSITKHIDKLIIVIIFVSLLPAMISWLRNRSAKRDAATAPPV
jgi:membrane-associated protein